MLVTNSVQIADIAFTRTELAVLAQLTMAAGDVVSKDQIANGVWGPSVYGNRHHDVEVHISKLRAKLKDSPYVGIKTIRGSGYRLTLANITPETRRKCVVAHCPLNLAGDPCPEMET